MSMLALEKRSRKMGRQLLKESRAIVGNFKHEPQPEEWIGRTISDVQIQKMLSRGGMGEVYLGWHETDQRPVAVKVMHAQMRMDSQFHKRFRAEAQALTAMSHPNIVQCLDCNVVNGRPYFIMELLQGQPFDVYHKRIN